MNNPLRQTMCTRMSMISQELLESDNTIERTTTRIFEESRQLLRNIRAGNIDQPAAARELQRISVAADEMTRTLRYLGERLRLLNSFLSGIDKALSDRKEP